SLASAHMPPKSNVKGLRGLETRTGASNFDVAEAVWLKLARELAAEAPTIALLCKTSVARNILQFAHRTGLPLAEATIRRLDRPRWFRASVDACWFQVTLAKSGEFDGRDGCQDVPVYRTLESDKPATVMGFSGGWLIADRTAHRRCAFADGICSETWRQGL